MSCAQSSVVVEFTILIGPDGTRRVDRCRLSSGQLNHGIALAILEHLLDRATAGEARLQINQFWGALRGLVKLLGALGGPRF